VLLLAGACSHTWAQLVPFQDEGSGLYGYRNGKSGKVKVDPVFLQALPFTDKLAKVKAGSGWGVIKKNGKYLIEPAYAQLGWSNEPPMAPLNFRSGLIAGKQGGKWQLLNEKGRKVPGLILGEITPFSDGIAIAQDTNGLHGLLQANGSWSLPTQYRKVRYLSPNHVAVQNDSTGLWGLYGTSGKQLFPELLYQIANFQQGVAIAEKDGRLGALDTQGETVQPFVHKKLTFNEGMWQKVAFPKWSVYSAEGQKLTEVYADSLIALGQQRFWVLRGNSGSLFLGGKELATLPLATHVEPFKEGAAIFRQNGLYGAISQAGKVVVPPGYEHLSLDQNGYFFAEKDGKAQLLNPKGQQVSDSEWQKVSPASYGFYLIRTRAGYRFFDKQLQPAFGGRTFRAATTFQNGHACVGTPTGYGVIDTLGRYVISPYVDSLHLVNGQYFLFEENGLYGSVNTQGVELFKTAVPFQAFDLGNGYVRITSGKVMGLLSRFGNLLLPVQQEIISPITPDSLVRFKRKGRTYYMDLQSYEVPKGEVFANMRLLGDHRQKFFPTFISGGYGFVDYLGRIRVSPQYEAVTFFSEGLAGFKLGGRWGYLNQSDRIVIQPLYDAVSPFKNGLAVVKQDGKFGLVDRSGELKLPIEYDRIAQSRFGNIEVEQNGKKGLLSRQTFNGLYPRFEAVIDCGNGTALVLRNGKWGASKVTGETLLYPQFPNLTFMPENGVFVVKNLLVD